MKLSRVFAYAALGVLLSFGAPLGLWLVRGIVEGGPFSLAGVFDAVAATPIDYAYVALSTAVFFGAFGAWLGIKADALAVVAVTDPLTGLANRRQLERRMADEMVRAARYAQPVSLLLIDVDHLKQLNDRHGHRGGDEALRLVARAMHDCVRVTDVPARFGGDEFAVLAPQTPAADAVALAERIRAALKTARLGDDPVSVSIGAADMTHFATREARWLIEAADQALYTAKRDGRDRVAMAPPVAVTPGTVE